MYELNLDFPRLALGTHQTPWDLHILLHKGLAKLPRKKAIIISGEIEYGESEEIRLPLVCAFHEVITSMINKGRSRALVISSLETLWRFYAWADETNIIGHCCK